MNTIVKFRKRLLVLEKIADHLIYFINEDTKRKQGKLNYLSKATYRVIARVWTRIWIYHVLVQVLSTTH